MNDRALNNTSLMAELIVKQLEGTITEEEYDALHQWLREKETHQQLFDQLLEEESMGKGLDKVRRIEERKEERLASIMDLIQSTKFRGTYFLATKRKQYIAAASILFCLGIGALLYVITRKATDHPSSSSITTTASYTYPDIPPGGDKAVLTLGDGSKITLDSTASGTLASQGQTQVLKLASGQLAYKATGATSPKEVLYNRVATPRGGRYQVLLPDGSQVWLNAASSLRFPTAFTDRERSVELTGEAYFEIVKNPGKLFRVQLAPKAGETEGMVIEVLGTHFNVNAYSDERAITTTLVEGAVRVRKGDAMGMLKRGQQAELLEAGTIRIVEHADVQQAIAWKNGLFIFENTDIKTVMRQIARWYDVEVVYEGKTPELSLTGKVPRNMTLANLLKALQGLKIHLKIEGRKIIVIA